MQIKTTTIYKDSHFEESNDTFVIADTKVVRTEMSRVDPTRNKSRTRLQDLYFYYYDNVYAVTVDGTRYAGQIIVMRDEEDNFYQDIRRGDVMNFGKWSPGLMITENIWPNFSDKLSKAPVDMPKSFRKQPRLQGFGRLFWRLWIRRKLLREAEICEYLKKNPHPNVVEYYGCDVDADNRIKGLHFARHEKSLHQVFEGTERLDVTKFMKGLVKGINHLHSLGLVHNDIDPHNIMLDNEDNAIIIDFDTCQVVGHPIYFKNSIYDTEILLGNDPTEIADPMNDLLAVMKIRDLIMEHNESCDSAEHDSAEQNA